MEEAESEVVMALEAYLVCLIGFIFNPHQKVNKAVALTTWEASL